MVLCPRSTILLRRGLSVSKCAGLARLQVNQAGKLRVIRKFCDASSKGTKAEWSTPELCYEVPFLRTLRTVKIISVTIAVVSTFIGAMLFSNPTGNSKLGKISVGKRAILAGTVVTFGVGTTVFVLRNMLTRIVIRAWQHNDNDFSLDFYTIFMRTRKLRCSMNELSRVTHSRVPLTNVIYAPTQRSLWLDEKSVNGALKERLFPKMEGFAAGQNVTLMAEKDELNDI